MEENHLSFDSYNAMGRTASYMGVPQFVLLGIIFLGIVVTGISCIFFSWYGLTALIMPVTLFVAVRVICESDSRFLIRLRFMLRRYLKNMIFGRMLLITPYNPQWN